MKILLLLPLLLGFSVPAIAHNEANGGKGTENNPYSNFIMEKGDVDDEAERPAISDFSSQDKKRRKFNEESFYENINIINKRLEELEDYK